MVGRFKTAINGSQFLKTDYEWDFALRSYPEVAMEPDAEKFARPDLLERCAAAMRTSTLTNGRKVADWMGELIGRSVSRQRGWEYLQHMKFRLRTPRPQHQEVDLMELEVRKKKLAIEVEQIQTKHPEAEVELWAMDEHRIGLKPVIRDMWVNEWEPPIAKVNWRFKWLWL